MGGSFISSLSGTDARAGWTQAVPLLAREQSLVLAGLEAIVRQLLFPVLGIDSDDDSVFINETITQYYANLSNEFHPFPGLPEERSGFDGAEEPGGLRRFIGHVRYSGQVEGQTMATCMERCAST